MRQIRRRRACYKKYMENNKRKNEIMALIGEVSADEAKIIEPLLYDVVFLEDKLEDLKKYPFISVNPKNPAQQKTTPAGKQYKELLQQYINCIKVVTALVGKTDISEESPLRKWLKNRI